MKTLVKFTSTLALILLCCSSCTSNGKGGAATTFDKSSEKDKINMMLDSFHLAAARADYEAYFSFYADDAIFTGTDATERWNKREFMKWAKPYFDKGKAWNFTSLERHIYFNKTGDVAWFDELLNTQMKICRGSGVLVKKGNNWKIRQYILSATVPNAVMDSVVKLKAPVEDSLIIKMSH